MGLTHSAAYWHWQLQLKHATLLQGPPPGFGTAPAPASNGNAPPGFPSHSGSDGSAASGHDQHAPHWPASQDAQQQWSNFHQYHPSPTVQGGPSGLYQSQSAPPTGYQLEPFAMPGLSNLQSMRQQPGADHCLFSGTSNMHGFPPSQLRQRSRFQFAQDQAAPHAADCASPSVYTSPLLSPALQQHPSQFQYGYGQSQHDRQQSDNYLFSSGSCLAGESLFSGPPGLSKPRGVPHQLGMQLAVGSHGGDSGSVTMMGSPGGHEALCLTHIYTRSGVRALCGHVPSICG